MTFLPPPSTFKVRRGGKAADCAYRCVDGVSVESLGTALNDPAPQAHWEKGPSIGKLVLVVDVFT